jgi:hypothetical protein
MPPLPPSELPELPLELPEPVLELPEALLEPALELLAPVPPLALEELDPCPPVEDEELPECEELLAELEALLELADEDPLADDPLELLPSDPLLLSLDSESVMDVPPPSLRTSASAASRKLVDDEPEPSGALPSPAAPSTVGPRAWASRSS